METSNKTKASSSSSEKKNKLSFLELLGCCGSHEREDKKTKRNFPNHPASKIDLDYSNAKSTLNTNPDFLNFGLLKSNEFEPNSEVSLLRNDHITREVFILGRKAKIIAKITSLNVAKTKSSVNMITSLSPDMKEQKKFRESLDSQKLKKKESLKESLRSSVKKAFVKNEYEIDSPQMIQPTSESLAIHIAKRLQCDIVIDALCGVGGNAIQFANYCNYVIAIDSNPERIACAKYNAQKNGAKDKFDFLTIDFLKIRKLTGDIVFLHPTDIRRDQNDTFSVFKHLHPNLVDLLAKSYEISNSVAMKLPYDTDLEELAELFHFCFEKKCLHQKRFCIEIERIFDLDNKPECIIVYFGDCSTIEQKDEFEAIYEYICSKEEQNQPKPTIQVVSNIVDKINLQKAFKVLTEIEETKSQEKLKDSYFGAFVSKIINENIITREAYAELQEEESKRPSSSLFSITNSYISSVALLKKNSSTLNDTTFRSNLVDGNKKGLAAQVSHHARWRSNPNQEPMFTQEEMKTTKNRPIVNKFAEEEFGFKVSASTPPSSSRLVERFHTENEEVLKDSHEVSELTVSSYSVESNYLQDYTPEDENGMNIKASINKKEEEKRPQKMKTSISSTSLKAKDRDSLRSANIGGYLDLSYKDGEDREKLNPSISKSSMRENDLFKQENFLRASIDDSETKLSQLKKKLR